MHTQTIIRHANTSTYVHTDWHSDLYTVIQSFSQRKSLIPSPSQQSVRFSQSHTVIQSCSQPDSYSNISSIQSKGDKSQSTIQISRTGQRISEFNPMFYAGPNQTSLIVLFRLSFMHRTWKIFLAQYPPITWLHYEHQALCRKLW